MESPTTYDLLVVERPESNAFSFGFGPEGEGGTRSRGVIVLYTGEFLVPLSLQFTQSFCRIHRRDTRWLSVLALTSISTPVFRLKVLHQLPSDLILPLSPFLRPLSPDYPPNSRTDEIPRRPPLSRTLSPPPRTSLPTSPLSLTN